MGKRILIIQGHPDPTEPHLCHAPAERYRADAVSAGHEVRTADVARLDLPLLRSQRQVDRLDEAGRERWFSRPQTLGRKAD